MYNPFSEVIKAQWLPVAERAVEHLNVNAVVDYNTKYANYVQNWQSYGSEAWFSTRYTLPVPENEWVVGIVDFESGGKSYKIPGPVQSKDLVCTAKPMPKRETAPDGIVAEFSAPFDANEPFGRWRAGKWTTAPNGHKAVNPHNGLEYKLEVVKGPIGNHIWWTPVLPI